jgi:hypothetical protein
MFKCYEPCPRCRERGKDGRGDNLAVYSDGGGHCFSCGYHVFPPSSSHWGVKKVDHDKESKVKRILPDDFSWDIPARCWEWLLQYGLPYDYWKPIIGWSEYHQRLVFRVGNPLQFSIGRLFNLDGSSQMGNHSIKRKWYVWGDAHRHVEVLGTGQSVVLVEDLISAHKVSQVINTVPLFGTQISSPILYYLKQENKPIILWLDNDQFPEVYKKADNLRILTGLSVSVIRSELDPKEYNANQISHFISSCGS